MLMKIPVAITVAVMIISLTAEAQYVRAIQRAKEVSGQVTQRQKSADNESAPGAPAQPAAKPATPQPVVAPVKPSTQQQAATKLKADIAEARIKGEATADLKKQFVQDLAVAALGHSKPSPAALAKFGEALLPAVAAKNVTLTDDSKLVKAIVVLLNSAGLPSTRLQELNDEVQGVLAKAGVSTADVGSIGEDLSAVAAEIQSGASK
jgi:hypothetical protein